VFFDPQTSGGLLIAVDPSDAEQLIRDLQAIGLPAAIVGKIIEREETEIYVTKGEKES
jgi:selenide,water dikinase